MIRLGSAWGHFGALVLAKAKVSQRVGENQIEDDEVTIFKGCGPFSDPLRSPSVEPPTGWYMVPKY